MQTNTHKHTGIIKHNFNQAEAWLYAERNDYKPELVEFDERTPVQMVAIATDAIPEQRLFQAKIIQYLQDSIATRPCCTPSDKAVAKNFIARIHKEANGWFNVENQDFLLTCDAAGWSPYLALAMYTNVQQAGTVPRLVKILAKPHEPPKKKKRKKSFYTRHPSLLENLCLS